MGKCSTILMEAKTWRPLSRTREREVGGGGGRGGSEEPVGDQPRSPRSCADTRAPQWQASRSPGGRQRGCKPDCQRRETSGLGMTLLSASTASKDPSAGRPPRSHCGFSDCAGLAEAARDRVQGASGLVQRLSALRVPHSPVGLQSEPGPTHRARPQPALQPRVRAAWPVLAFGFVALLCPGTSPETRATRA